MKSQIKYKLIAAQCLLKRPQQTAMKPRLGSFPESKLELQAMELHLENEIDQNWNITIH